MPWVLRYGSGRSASRKMTASSRNVPEGGGFYHRAVTSRTDPASVLADARGCTRCPGLVVTRTQVVVGTGDADADLLLVADAPGSAEDEQGAPLRGPAGRLLDELLEGIGLARADVFVTHVLMCRPPGNRDPQAAEVANCRAWLLEAVARVRPAVVCPLGSFATKLLRADPAPITAVHGRAEVRLVGDRAVHLLPLFHPAAALYTAELTEALRADVALLPDLLALGPPEQPAPPDPPPPEAGGAPDVGGEQLGLF